MRISDWSSDVCSSDLGLDAWRVGRRHFLVVIHDTDELVRRRRAVAFTGASADRLCVDEVGAAKILRPFEDFDGAIGTEVDDADIDERARLGLDEALWIDRFRDRGCCGHRSEEHTSELQSLMRNSYA